MLKFLKYMRFVFSLFILVVLSSCGDNGGFFYNRTSGEELGDPQEAKLREYYSRLEERKVSLGLLRQDGGAQTHHLISMILWKHLSSSLFITSTTSIKINFYPIPMR